MKTLIIESAQEIMQSPKTALVITGGAAVNGALQHWVETNIGWVSGLAGLMGVIIVTIIQIIRSRREKREHELNVKSHELDIKLKEKELNE